MSMYIEKMVRLSGKLLGRLPFSGLMSFHTTLIHLVQFPIVGRLYHTFYQPVIARKAQGGPTRVFIETYNVCNQRCPMCPYQEMTRKKVMMDMNLFRNIVDQLAGSTIRVIELFGYSEPLLDPLLFERIDYCKSKGIKVYISTNGVLLTPEKRKAILGSRLDAIGFSLDATTAETYRNVRGSADFERVKENVISFIKERNERPVKRPLVRLNFVVQQDNCHEVEEFKAFWRGLADKVEVWDLVSKGERVSRLLVKRRDPLKLHPRYLYACLLVFVCPGILSDGRVILCNYDFDGSLPLGDLKTQTFNEIWNSAKFREIRELHLAGRGDRIGFCRETHCQFLYQHAYTCWWGEDRYPL